MPVKKKPARKTATTKRKPARKTAAKKKTTKKATARKPAAKKATGRKTTAKKATGRKTTARKATGRKTTARKAAPKRSAKAKTKRKPNAAFMKPMMPSGPLSEVIGAKAMPRTEVTKKIWAYIKKNGLQDAKKRTMINADDKLKAVFGGKKQVSMFEMTKLVSKHLKDA
ncbi:MAG: hypothetical protein Kow0074_03950 [Candidatus Zixiibacteriota bacterium]